jgi:hypothetical protein
MATYKFEQFEAEIINPKVIMDGAVGTRFLNGEPLQVTFAEVKLITSSSKLAVLLQDSTTPSSWSTEDLQIWINDQMEKHLIQH